MWSSAEWDNYRMALHEGVTVALLLLFFITTVENIYSPNNDINRTLGYHVKAAILFNYFILFFRAVSGLKSAKYLCRMHKKIFKSSYCV